MNQKELKEILEKRTKEIDIVIENKESFTNKEIIKIAMWMGQAMLLIEIFKKTDMEIYSFLKKLSGNDIKTSPDIKNVVLKFIDFLKNLTITQPYPTPVGTEKSSYWNIK